MTTHPCASSPVPTGPALEAALLSGDRATAGPPSRHAPDRGGGAARSPGGRTRRAPGLIRLPATPWNALRDRLARPAHRPHRTGNADMAVSVRLVQSLHENDRPIDVREAPVRPAHRRSSRGPPHRPAATRGLDAPAGLRDSCSSLRSSPAATTRSRPRPDGSPGPSGTRARSRRRGRIARAFARARTGAWARRTTRGPRPTCGPWAEARAPRRSAAWSGRSGPPPTRRAAVDGSSTGDGRAGGDHHRE